jgi:hypothetical protein
LIPSISVRGRSNPQQQAFTCFRKIGHHGSPHKLNTHEDLF